MKCDPCHKQIACHSPLTAMLPQSNDFYNILTEMVQVDCGQRNSSEDGASQFLSTLDTKGY